MGEVKGKYILKLDELLSECNPEIAQAAQKELTMDINEIDSDSWYDSQIVKNYMNKVSHDAQIALGKMLVKEVYLKNDKILERFKNPAEFIKLSVEKFSSDEQRIEDPYKNHVVDYADDFVIVKRDDWLSLSLGRSLSWNSRKI